MLLGHWVHQVGVLVLLVELEQLVVLQMEVLLLVEAAVVEGDLQQVPSSPDQVSSLMPELATCHPHCRIQCGTFHFP